ncbi:hypothetical protein [Capillimicrobium parvum]|uniref:Uncharacterized protein n=1 Tax=Capillimicrobium parvum TaxID=2884022 RepID=A0A9E7BZK9_9ACTN|nr:hypothetical protein [Capillimicrobium parvum]UGS35490.1 hypothetical protein DSM104329_01880 [Capillimicrobium parvum]
MRLDDVDDLPFHQVSTPFNVVGTSDVHFNDGYWFAAYAPGDWYVIFGMRLHPNMNVVDGFAGLARDGEQRVVRASRALRPRYTELEAGPLRIELVRPMQEIRVSLAGSPVDLAFDLVFQARGAAFVEAPYRHLKFGHVINDMVRYTQVCRASGTLRCDGAEVAVDGWHAMRDHSWGVRSTMGPRTPHGGVDAIESEADLRRYRLWVPFETDDHGGFFNTHEGEDGRPLDFEGQLTYPDGRVVALTEVRHEIEYEPGTRYVTGGAFAVLDEHGAWHEYRLEEPGTPADVQGFGYYGGWHDGGSAGVWRGAGPHVESDRYAVAARPAGPPHVPMDRRLGPTEFPFTISGPGGVRGMAHFEHHVMGRYAPYGFQGRDRK